MHAHNIRKNALYCTDSTLCKAMYVIIRVLVHNAHRDQAELESKSDLLIVVYSTCPLDLSA